MTLLNMVMKKFTILAIDQSYTSSGIVIFRNGAVVHCERFCTDKSKDIFVRAWEVSEHVAKLAKDWNAQLIAMEGLAFGGKGNATRDLAGLQFVITTQMRFIRNKDVKIYAPGTIKKLATGKGNSPKTMLLDVIPDEIRTKFDDLGVKKTTGLLDLVDAYWIGRTAIEDIK